MLESYGESEQVPKKEGEGSTVLEDVTQALETGELKDAHAFQ